MLDYRVAATDSLVASEQSETVFFQRRLRLVAVSPMLTMALSSPGTSGAASFIWILRVLTYNLYEYPDSVGRKRRVWATHPDKRMWEDG